MSYLREARAARAGAGEATVAAVGGVPCPVAGAPTLEGAAAASAGGGEEGRTHGLKLSPMRVLAMLGLGKRWRGWRGSLL